MNDQHPVTPDPAAATYGALIAIQAAIRALVLTHPDIPALSKQMREEKERELAHLLTRGVPDSALEMFEEVLDSINVLPEDPRNASVHHGQ